MLVNIGRGIVDPAGRRSRLDSGSGHKLKESELEAFVQAGPVEVARDSMVLPVDFAMLDWPMDSLARDFEIAVSGRKD